MNSRLFYQIRIYFSSEFSNIFNSKESMPLKDKLLIILKNHNAHLLSQYDGFKSYVLESEKQNNINDPLYKWTKDSLNNKNKLDKYNNSYTVYANSEEVYSKDVANSLEDHLKKIIDNRLILSISKHDTNPKNNPQPPSKYYK